MSSSNEHEEEEENSKEQETPGHFEPSASILNTANDDDEEENDNNEEDEEEQQQDQSPPPPPPPTSTTALSACFDNTIEHHFDLSQDHLGYRTRHSHRATDCNGNVLTDRVNDRSGVITTLKYDLFLNNNEGRQQRSSSLNSNYSLIQIENVLDPITGKDTSSVRHHIGEPPITVLRKYDDDQRIEETPPGRFKSTKLIQFGKKSPPQLIHNPTPVLFDTGIKLGELASAGKTTAATAMHDSFMLQNTSDQDSDESCSEMLRKRAPSNKERSFASKSNGHIPNHSKSNGAAASPSQQRDLNNNWDEEPMGSQSTEDDEDQQKSKGGLIEFLKSGLASIWRLLCYAFFITVVLGIASYLALPRLIPLCCRLQKEYLFVNTVLSDDDQFLPH
jgi:hypothetical protein